MAATIASISTVPNTGSTNTTSWTSSSSSLMTSEEDERNVTQSTNSTSRGNDVGGTTGTTSAAAAASTSPPAGNSTTNNTTTNEQDNNEEEGDISTSPFFSNSSNSNPFTSEHTTSTDQIEELVSMEQRKRRTTVILLIFFFLLMRLWMQALSTGDVGILIVSIMMTVWMIKIHQQRRIEEEEWNRQWADYLHGNGNSNDTDNNTTTNNENESNGEGLLGAGADFSHMSFQMQLALAMMESQRIMQMSMRNGGMPVNSHRNGESAGVSREIMDGWTRFPYQSTPLSSECGGGVAVGASPETADNNNKKTKLSLLDKLKAKGRKYDSLNEEEEDDVVVLHDLTLEEEERMEHGQPTIATTTQPEKTMSEEGGEGDVQTCSICLCEYEQGEEIVRLPCGHVYHDSCISVWVQNHVRCPLCNFNLVEEDEDADTHENHIV